MKKNHALVEYGLVASLVIVFVIMALGKISSSISNEADAENSIPATSSFSK